MIILIGILAINPAVSAKKFDPDFTFGFWRVQSWPAFSTLLPCHEIKKRTWNLSLHSSGVKCTYKASISSRATCLNKNMCINICIVFKIRKKKKVCLQTWGIFLKIRYFCTSLFGIVNGNMLFTYTFCRVTYRALLVNTALCHQHLIFFFWHHTGFPVSYHFGQ